MNVWCPVVQDFIRTRLNAGYDPEYLQQLFDFLVYIISSLEAPARSDSTKKVRHYWLPLTSHLFHKSCIQIHPIRGPGAMGAFSRVCMNICFTSWDPVSIVYLMPIDRARPVFGFLLGMSASLTWKPSALQGHGFPPSSCPDCRGMQR